MDEKCLTRAQVAERYQITEQDVEEFEALHRIPVLRFGKSVRYDANALAAFEAAARGEDRQEREPGTPQAGAGAVDAPSPPTDAPKGLFGLRDALQRLGCGRTYLDLHLAAHPMHEGQPTHRRIGRKIMFTAEDFDRLLATMAGDLSPFAKRKTQGRAVPAGPSVEKAYRDALKAAQRTIDRGKRPKA